MRFYRVLPSKTGNATFARDCARLADSGFTFLLKPGDPKILFVGVDKVHLGYDTHTESKGFVTFEQ